MIRRVWQFLSSLLGNQTDRSTILQGKEETRRSIYAVWFPKPLLDNAPQDIEIIQLDGNPEQWPHDQPIFVYALATREVLWNLQCRYGRGAEVTLPFFATIVVPAAMEVTFVSDWNDIYDTLVIAGDWESIRKLAFGIPDPGVRVRSRLIIPQSMRDRSDVFITQHPWLRKE